MKKFTFTLQSVLRVKTIQEKQIKAELAEIQGQLNDLFAQRTDFQQQLEISSAQYGDELQKGLSVPRMAWFSNFADYINGQLKQLEVQVRKTEQKLEEKKAELIAAVKEIKTIEKLREEQYRAYLEEVSKEEEKVLGDLISYNNTVEAAG